MARRASSRNNSGTTIGFLIGVIIILVVGFFLINRKPSGGYSSPELPVQSFLSNANSLRGNTYSVEGRVHKIVTGDSRKFIDLAVEDSGRDQHVPIIVPNDLNSVNIEREQLFAFEIIIEKGGIPVATSLKRL